MKIFGSIYNKMMNWSRHKFSIYWLNFISFIEAIFFPIPPDVMLIPMSIAQPKKATKYALTTGLSSVLGGMIGYAIGFYFVELVEYYVAELGYMRQWQIMIAWMQEWDVLVIFLAGFTPIPYKIFTIAAGVMQIAFLPFCVISYISRTARFLMVAKLSAWGGQRFETEIRKYIELIGWAVIVLGVVLYFVIRAQN